MQADSPDKCPEPGSRLSELLKDEALAGDISAYIDGRLKGDALAKMKKMLASDPSLAQEIAELRRVSESLKLLGAEILDEPVPAALIATLRGASSKN
jgi:anti-sigma factor RsiW